MLRLDDVAVRAGGRTILRGVSLRADASSVTLVTGANGSGKTSLLRLVAGITRPGAGRRTFAGQTIAFVAGAFDPPSARARTWLCAMARTPEPAAMATLDALGFDGVIDGPCRELSMGNLRKLALGAALAGGVDLIVIDEISAGLDAAGRTGLTELLGHRCDEGAVAVLSDQGTGDVLVTGLLARRSGGGARRLLLADGRLQVTEASEGGGDVGPLETDVRFAGTPAQLSSLRSHARSIGAREVNDPPEDGGA